MIMNPVSIVSERLAIAKAFVSGLGANQAVQEDLGFLSFVLTLLPIPGVQQAAQVTQRMADNRGLNLKLEEIWQAISTTNQAVRAIDNLDQKVEAIANTVRYNSELQRRVEEAIAELKQDLAQTDSTWSVETSGCSTQELVNVIVEASHVTISAVDGSRNALQGMNVTAQQTRLIADGGSHNSVRDSTFAGQKGTIAFNGDHTVRGAVNVQDASLGFGDRSSIQMGNFRIGTTGDGGFSFDFMRPARPSLICPKCRWTFVRPDNVSTLLQLPCPKCGFVAQVPPLR